MFYQILIIFFMLLIICYKYLTRNFDHWKKRNINGPQPKLLYGNFPSLFHRQRNMAEDINDIYQSYKNQTSFVGVYVCCAPLLIITDIDLVRRVFVNDFKHFHDNEISDYVDKKNDYIFGYNPFSLAGEEWKQKRAEIAPGITMTRIKGAFPITQKVCQIMIKFIEKQIIMDSKNGIDGKDISLRFTSEVVTNFILGFGANSFTEQPLPTTKILKNLLQNSWLFNYREIISGLFPVLSKYFKMRFVSKKAELYCINILQEAINLRRNQKDQNFRTDFLNYMLQLQEKKQLSIMALSAHMMTFIFDGFETTALTMAHCLLFLGRDIKRQKKLRQEIQNNLAKLQNFDAIMELPYLNACIHETLRIFPPLPIPMKVCTESIEYNDKNEKQVKIFKGDIVLLPIRAIMMDENNYRNAETFQPERFLHDDNNLKTFKEKGLYYGFGEGPRICLGMRFALAQIKVALIEIFNHYTVKVHSKTRTDNKLVPNYFLSSLDGGIYLEFEKLQRI